ncbi:MAG: dihydroorotase [Oscillospiraceae bacterium]|jgi:dihydroorotase|nr:dihydroorotase [Oscillospiraceae bacterium]
MKMLLLKNARVVDYLTETDNKSDILINAGEILAISDNTTQIIENTIDCSGLIAIPGIFDMHVHARDPGQLHKEDLLTCSEAALAGGVTGFLCMPNTEPVIDSEEVIKYIGKKAESCKAKIYTACAVTVEQAGNRLCDFEMFAKAGVKAVTDDGRPVKSAQLMGEAMIKAGDAGLTVISHCEDLSIACGGLMNAGIVSIELGVRGMHRSSENIITSREIDLARDLYEKVHIAHVSTKEACAKIRAAKAEGIGITCETAPHYFALTESMLYGRDADYRMNPPLRLQADIDAVIKALQDGTIDCIITDHAPHSPEEKADFKTAPNGVTGLETSLAATLTCLYHTGKVSLSEIVRLMCVNPRKILGIEGGSLAVGQPADITLFAPDEEWLVEPEKFKSKARNSCFKNIKLKGRVKYTIVDGEIVYKD